MRVSDIWAISEQSEKESFKPLGKNISEAKTNVVRERITWWVYFRSCKEASVAGV